VKSELRTQYLQLQLSITQMGKNLQEALGSIRELSRENQRLRDIASEKELEAKQLQEKIKELEKNNKISDKIAKIVVNTENTVVPTTDLKKKLEQYISIIDHSIEALKSK
jgi:predicted nuclease with TOPRIM domain